MEPDKGVAWEWVIARYTGDMAKYVKSLADMGVGYFVRTEAGKAVNYSVEVALRRPLGSPRPERVVLADAMQVKKLDELYEQRHPSPNKGKLRVSGDGTTTKKLSDIVNFKRYSNYGNNFQQSPATRN